MELQIGLLLGRAIEVGTQAQAAAATVIERLGPLVERIEALERGAMVDATPSIADLRTRVGDLAREVESLSREYAATPATPAPGGASVLGVLAQHPFLLCGVVFSAVAGVVLPIAVVLGVCLRPDVLPLLLSVVTHAAAGPGSGGGPDGP